MEKVSPPRPGIEPSMLIEKKKHITYNRVPLNEAFPNSLLSMVSICARLGQAVPGDQYCRHPPLDHGLLSVDLYHG